MNIIFMNSKNSKTPDSHKLLLSLTDKLKWKRSDEDVALTNLEIKMSYKNNKFQISVPSWKESSDETYSVWNTQDYFEYVLKNMGETMLIHQ